MFVGWFSFSSFLCCNIFLAALNMCLSVSTKDAIILSRISFIKYLLLIPILLILPVSTYCIFCLYLINQANEFCFFLRYSIEKSRNEATICGTLYVYSMRRITFAYGSFAVSMNIILCQMIKPFIANVCHTYYMTSSRRKQMHFFPWWIFNCCVRNVIVFYVACVLFWFDATQHSQTVYYDATNMVALRRKIFAVDGNGCHSAHQLGQNICMAPKNMQTRNSFWSKFNSSIY